jgi:hypothetical protein
VEVADEGGAGEGAVERLGLAEEAQAGAQVEDDRLLAGDLEGDARGVAAVAKVRFGRTGRRSSNTEECDVEQLRSPRVSGEDTQPCLLGEPV